jgi:hypothetical protein
LSQQLQSGGHIGINPQDDPVGSIRLPGSPVSHVFNNNYLAAFAP